MAALLPILLVAGAATAVMMGRNMEEISPTTAASMEAAWENAGNGVSSVGQGLQNFVAQDAVALQKSEVELQKKSDGHDPSDSESDYSEHEYPDSDDDSVYSRASTKSRDSDEEHEYHDYD